MTEERKILCSKILVTYYTEIFIFVAQRFDPSFLSRFVVGSTAIHNLVFTWFLSVNLCIFELPSLGCKFLTFGIFLSTHFSLLLMVVAIAKQSFVVLALPVTFFVTGWTTDMRGKGTVVDMFESKDNYFAIFQHGV